MEAFVLLLFFEKELLTIRCSFKEFAHLQLHSLCIQPSFNMDSQLNIAI